MKSLFGTKIQGYARTRIIDSASGRVMSKREVKIPNLVLDVGLNALATGGVGVCGFAGLFSNCKIGSGTNPNQIASGAITFTQLLGTVTASLPFFNISMIGGILKYGIGGAGTEQYITGFTDSTHVTVSSSATVLATVGTVWQVQQTALQTFLFNSTTYDASGGSNSSVFSTNVATMQRTINFPVQATTYDVNEIGYGNAGAGACLGRVVLPSTDVVSPSQFYQVEISMVYTVHPGAATAVPNVGSGFNTAGQAMFLLWDCLAVQTDGTNAQVQGSFPTGLMDNSNGAAVVGLSILPVTYPANPTTTGLGVWTCFVQLGSVTLNNTAQPVGVAAGSLLFSVSTSGQLCQTIAVGAAAGGSVTDQFLQLITTPFAVPTGTFAGTVSFTNTFNRNLIN